MCAAKTANPRLSLLALGGLPVLRTKNRVARAPRNRNPVGQSRRRRRLDLDRSRRVDQRLAARSSDIRWQSGQTVSSSEFIALAINWS